MKRKVLALMVPALLMANAVNAAEITHAGQRDTEQTVNELVHLRAAQRHFCADGHALAQFKVCNRLFGLANNRALAGNGGKVRQDRIHDLRVVTRFATAAVNNDFVELRDLHDALVPEFLHQGGSDLFGVLLF